LQKQKPAWLENISHWTVEDGRERKSARIKREISKTGEAKVETES